MLTYNDVTDLVMRAKQFEELAAIDGLTGLYNRRHFDVLAEAEWSCFQRYRRPLSLFLIDIDQFKEINDQRGHEAGDVVLKKLATISMGVLRPCRHAPGRPTIKSLWLTGRTVHRVPMRL